MKSAAADPGTTHWAFRPVTDRPPPATKSHVDHPIDRFVQAKLEEKGWRLSPAADRRTLIRRVTYDLAGLMPTPEEVEAFVADTSSTAYEQLVDRLLDSPHYGERRPGTGWTLRPIRRHQGLRLHRRIATTRIAFTYPRLGDSIVQRRSALRPVHPSISSPPTGSSRTTRRIWRRWVF